MTNSISGRILEGSRTLRDGFNAHPFVMGIAGGTLSLEQFKYFNMSWEMRKASC